MSNMIPQETVDAFRNFNDVAVDLCGIDCELYVANNLDVINMRDPYQINKVEFNAKVDTKVFMLFNPDAKQLRKYGIYTEKNIPVVAFFKNLDPEVVIRSYFKIDMQYVPNQTVSSDEFEVVDTLIKHAHDAVLLNGYEVAPRRVRS